METDLIIPTTDTEIKLKKEASTAVLGEDKEDFTAVFEEDSDDNLLLWRDLFGSKPSLPKKGDMVVYFPQGHLEYANSHLSLPSTDVPTFSLQPQIICWVQQVQLIANKKNGEICAHVTLRPESEQNSKGKEPEESIEDNEDEKPKSSTKSARKFFTKKLKATDMECLSISSSSAASVLFPSDHQKISSLDEVIAKDFQGIEWIFKLKVEGRRKKLAGQWSNFLTEKKLFPGDTVVFLREKGRELRLGLRGVHRYEIGVSDSIIAKHYQYPAVLSPVADAIFRKSTFHVFYSPRVRYAEFMLPYKKYMKSISTEGLIGSKCNVRYPKTFPSPQRFTGVVTGITDLEPIKWPNSKWRCMVVNVDYPDKIYEERVSPWEIDGASYKEKFMPQLKGRGTSQQPQSKRRRTSQQPQSKRRRTSQQDDSPANFDPGKSKPQSYGFLKENEKLDREKCSSITSLGRSMSITSLKQLKITKFSEGEIFLELRVHDSLESLELDSCSFDFPIRLWDLPITLKKLKIACCKNIEYVITKLIDQKDLSLESLEIDGCSSFHSFPIHKLPATLRQLKIVNCMNLKSLNDTSEFKNCDSVGFGPIGGSSLPNVTSTSTLELRKLEIQDCVELEFLPEGLHNLIHLDLLSINNCSSLVSFPEGLPDTCLTSLLISECENLKFLPNKLQKVTSLQNLSISGCPSLMFFPEGGLPPNLVSLRIINCESLISLSQWELHKLKHLREYSFSGGCSDSGE